MSDKTTFTADLDLKFFAQHEFESTEGLETTREQAPVIVRNVLRVLMMGWTESWKQLLNPAVAYTVLIERNPEFLKHLRFAFQEGFLELFKQLDGQNLHETQNEQVQLYLSNCLSLLPYSDLTAYESIKIPQYIKGKWELVEYQVKPIELTEGTEWDSDRVFAYGLEPLFQREAESHLLFMGTTYPAGQGFLTQVNTDAKGFESVGKTLYRTGRARIQSWLAQQENKIHVCGTSLGGSLSLLLAIDQCDPQLGHYELSRVDALNPAGLHDARSKSRYDHWDELVIKPKVVVQKQGNDPVSYFGLWKDDWDVIQITPPPEKQGPNGFADHAINYAGLKGTTFTYIDPKEDNAKRKARNFWLFSFARSLVYYGILMPYTYVVRPVGYFVAKNWPLLLLVPCIILTVHFAVAGALAGIALAAVVTALTAIIAAALVQTFRSSREVPYAKMHDPDHPRNKSMDIYDKDNAVTIDITYKEVNTYYKIMCSFKGKDFLPADERVSKHVQGTTKSVLLEASDNLANADAFISFNVTKAKAAHIRHTLSLVKKIGVENQEQLKMALDDNYQEYRLGKGL